MKTEWLRGLNPQEVQKRKELVLSNKIVLDFLIEILYNMDRRAEVVASEAYDSPSWSHKQAHLNGERAMLRRIIELCDVMPDQGSKGKGA